MNKNVLSVCKALRTGFKIGYGLSGTSRDRKRRRYEAIMWRYRKRLNRSPIVEIGNVTDPLTGLSFTLSTQANGDTHIDMIYGQSSTKDAAVLLRSE